MGSKYFESSLLDKAIIFAVKKHSGTERKGQGFPYIAHPLEAMSIVATMTNDQELLAAACLHDVIEDTDTTYEEIKELFGQRIADIVLAESDNQNCPECDPENSWVFRKQRTIDHLANAPRDVQIVALGDKLSNMRLLAKDYDILGDELWNRFHVKNPKLHAWHYRGLLDSLVNLSEFSAYQEFRYLVNKTFGHRYLDFSYEFDRNEIHFSGLLNKENLLKLRSELTKNETYVFDFKNVYYLDFSGTRALLDLREEFHFIIRNASKLIFQRLNVSGVSHFISITSIPKEFHIDTLEQAGDGYTAATYWTHDGDGMIKLFYDFIDLKEVENEKRHSLKALEMGLPVPLSGDIIEIEGRYGIIYERIKEKTSFARLMANNPSNVEEIAKDFALMARKLHSTKCDEREIVNAKDRYNHYIDIYPNLTDEERMILHNFVNSARDTGTCLHGDFHFGNAIVTNHNEKLFIDLGDLSYGDPYFDLGILYFVTHNKNESMTERLFHTTGEVVYKFYQHFIRYYFDNKYSEEELDNILIPYAGLTALFFASKGGSKPWMDIVIREWIIKRV